MPRRNRPEFEVDQEVFLAGPELLGSKIKIERFFVLEWGPGDHYAIGYSRDPRSWTTAGFISHGLWFYATPQEALDAYVAQRTNSLKIQIKEACKSVKSAELEIQKLHTLTLKKVRMSKHAEDWTPCDW